ncbi:MAG: lysostaphin resistance A-like protein [Breznakia sp.]
MKTKLSLYVLSKKKEKQVLFIYFVGFTFIFPLLISLLLYSLHFNVANDLVVNVCVYAATLIFLLLVAFPLLKEESNFNISLFLKKALVGLCVLLGANIIYQLVVSQLFDLNTSANQASLREISKQGIFLFALMTLILAPIVEEVTFRGVLFKIVRRRFGFFTAAFLSSFIFGFMHVSGSLFLGQWKDFVYLFLYGIIAFIFAKVYEDTGSIFCPIVLHATYNAFGLATILLQ